MTSVATPGTGRNFEHVQITFGTYGLGLSSNEHATHLWMEVRLTIRGLTQGFRVQGIVKQGGVEEETLAAQLKATIVGGLPNSMIVDCFRIQNIHIHPKSPGSSAVEAESEVDELIAARLFEQAKTGNAAELQWRIALKQFGDGLHDGFTYNRRKIKDAMLYLEACHAAANNGTTHGWCEEKLAYIRAGLAELSRRIDVNHPTYLKIVNDIRGYLAHWPVVNSWHEEPPRRMVAMQ